VAVYEAVVFDMDGVLADSEPEYFAAMQEVLAPLGHEVTEQDQRAVMGHSIEDTWEYLRERFALGEDLSELMQAYDEVLLRRLAVPRQTLPGVSELVSALRELGVPVAVASSSLASWIEALLGGLRLQGAFDALVPATMVLHPKPAPDIYIEAARRLGKAPERCIAIEDTPTGLAAAKAAGMLTVQVRASSTAWPPQPDADVVLETLRDFDLRLVSSDASRTRR
jgi:HAD superfamily hydrolase (TIGR01509 family)